MEVSRLKHHIASGFVCAAALAAEHAGNAHRLFRVADGQVAVGEFMLLAVESLEGCALGHGLHHNLVACHHVSIEAVQRLTVGEHHVVGNVNYIVYRSQAYGCQAVLKPFRRLLDIAACDADARIAAASLRILYDHIDGKGVVINGERRVTRTMEAGLIAIALEPCIEVACHAPVRQCIGAVGGDINLYEPVALQVVILGSRCSHHCIVGQHDDTVVRRAHSYFVLSTYHAERLHTAQLRLLYLELLVAVVEHTPQVGNDNLLSGSHIWCAADNLAWCLASQVNGSHVQVVGVGMSLTGEHLTDK